MTAYRRHRRGEGGGHTQHTVFLEPNFNIGTVHLFRDKCRSFNLSSKNLASIKPTTISIRQRPELRSDFDQNAAVTDGLIRAALPKGAAGNNGRRDGMPR